MPPKLLKRKPYRRSDYLYLLHNYRHYSAADLARALVVLRYFHGLASEESA